MTFKEISDRFHDLTLYEKRYCTHSYVEVALFNKDAMEWEALLHEFFGPPAKEAAKKPSREIKVLTKAHGGIGKGQTLFKKESEDGLILVMLWPWQNKTHTTLKMFVFEENSGNHGRTSLRNWMRWLLYVPRRLIGVNKS